MKRFNNRDCGSLDATQLKNLKEFLPTEKENQAITRYLKSNKSAEKMDELCECEKYMVAMMDISKASSKLDCMIFRDQFQARLHHLNDDIQTMKNACEQVVTSESLRHIMAMILTVVNHINTSGHKGGDFASGFSLRALLKLNEVSCNAFSFNFNFGNRNAWEMNNASHDVLVVLILHIFLICKGESV